MNEEQDAELAEMFNRIGPVAVSATPGYWHVSMLDAEDIAYEGPTIEKVLSLMIEEWPEIMERLRGRDLGPGRYG